MYSTEKLFLNVCSDEGLTLETSAICTLNLTGEKHTISNGLVDQTHIQLTRQLVKTDWN